jgi:hypothetical protein
MPTPILEDPFAKYGEQAMEMLTPEGEDIFPSGFKSASSMTKRLYIVTPFASPNSKSMKSGALKNLKVNSSLTQGLKNSAASRIMGSRVTSPFALSPKKTEALKIAAAKKAFQIVVDNNDDDSNNDGGWDGRIFKGPRAKLSTHNLYAKASTTRSSTISAPVSNTYM